MVSQQLRWVRGLFAKRASCEATPHPFSHVAPPSCPLPQGERAKTARPRLRHPNVPSDQQLAVRLRKYFRRSKVSCTLVHDTFGTGGQTASAARATNSWKG